MNLKTLVLQKYADKNVAFESSATMDAKLIVLRDFFADFKLNPHSSLDCIAFDEAQFAKVVAFVRENGWNV